ncbi:hypothetical protein, conserved [Entamoeba histolytica HM-1:IMSS]|uniref:Uncharacterized protein n=2 Tax=Entamoeba TaxID=5758 RepID=B1N5L5_ENTH1|nr:hypothetical protein, conserved [Entamoeba histolytica HM-1:IMSS]EDS88743.1 hypothetical protein, conserved [Entamoeba histolytica HM-1:IMSS]|eukprot:XP_001914481.1 hypothetical protein, conserved [Entamoeba histolytica HM-1:IMSS]
MPQMNQPVMPNIQQPALPQILQPTLPTMPTIPQNNNMPAIPQPMKPIIPTQQNIPQPVLPTLPVMPQQQVAPQIPQPVLPQMPVAAPETKPVMPTMPTLPSFSPATTNVAAASDAVDEAVCKELKNVFGEVMSTIETKSKGTQYERVTTVALKRGAAFENSINKVPADIANHLIELFRDLLAGKYPEVDAAFKKLLVNKRINQFIPSSSVVSVKYIIDAAKQLK